MKLRVTGIIFSLIILFSISCKKDAGEGGTSTIRGKVRVLKYDNTFQLLQEDYYSPNEDVYIIYGTNHNTYDNDYKTSFNGEYEFKYLQKGTYKLFVLSTDTSGIDTLGSVNELLPKIGIFTTVNITSNNQTVSAPDLIILKYK